MLFFPEGGVVWNLSNLIISITQVTIYLRQLYKEKVLSVFTKSCIEIYSRVGAISGEGDWARRRSGDIALSTIQITCIF